MEVNEAEIQYVDLESLNQIPRKLEDLINKCNDMDNRIRNAVTSVDKIDERLSRIEAILHSVNDSKMKSFGYVCGTNIHECWSSQPCGTDM